MLSETVGMVLGRSSLTSQGFTVHPEIIDEDFKETKIVASIKGVMQFTTSARIVQMLLFPYIKGKADPVGRPGRFGSTEKRILAKLLMIRGQN